MPEINKNNKTETFVIKNVNFTARPFKSFDITVKSLLWFDELAALEIKHWQS